MSNLAKEASNQILLLAPDLLGESLALQLNQLQNEYKVCLAKEELTKRPFLIIWSIESLEVLSSIQTETRRLQDYWLPAPLLVLIPAKASAQTSELLQFDCSGILQDPDIQTLVKAITTLQGGGRVVRLKDQETKQSSALQPPMGLGQWLLLSGLQQINNELRQIQLLLERPPKSSIKELMLYGRKRELSFAKRILFWLWGPLQPSLDPYKSKSKSKISSPIGIEANEYVKHHGSNTEISLEEKNGLAVWSAIRGRLTEAIQEGLINSTGGLLAIEGLNSLRQRELLVALLDQLNELVKKMNDYANKNGDYLENWLDLQTEIKQQALRKMIGSYVRLELQGNMMLVGDQLLASTTLSNSDDELPKGDQMLDPLLLDKPVEVEGQLLPADNPRALIHLEMFFSNWLIRTAELISEEVIEACGDWPELRRYLLKPQLISTRELERLRNQLNSKNRWQSLVLRPIQLYESKRILYIIEKGQIQPFVMTEPRDEELRQLGWWQQQVALLVEARDALSPQIQTLVKHLGDLMVVILTQVVGRAIGLVGRGIAQGMGRSIGRG